MTRRTRLLAWLLALALASPLPATAQSATAPPATAAPATAQPSGTAGPAFTSEQLEQVAAPIALYPDPLLAQVLMASTYPLEVVQAARFVKDNPKLQGDQLNEKLKDQTWDDSVKSLVSFPQALQLMDQKLEWTQKLGDAFLAQEKELLDAIQRLRARAQAEGNLKTTKEQTVTVQPAAPPAPAQSGQTARGPAIDQRDHDRAGQSNRGVRALLQSHGRLRRMAVPGVLRRTTRTRRVTHGVPPRCPSAWAWRSALPCGAIATGAAATWTSMSTGTRTSRGT